MRQADNRTPKSEPDSEAFLQRATKAFQTNVTQAAPMAAASYTLVGSILLLGLIGYGLDRWLGSAPWLLLTGLLVGLIVGFYELARVIWRQ